RASCAGALVVAAAGNRDLASGTGMVYPAAWEALPAPSVEACRSYPLPSSSGAAQLPVFPPAGTTAYRPLVHAVGAVDALDRPAGITRQGGRPRLAAYGVGVVAYEPRTGGSTRIKTGTSLSAAVASGAAALAWAYNPTLRADEIMAVLHKTGQAVAPSVELKPDLCAGQDCTGSIRRISACNAAAKVFCNASSCGSALPCKTVPAFGGDLPSPLVDWSAEGFPTLELTTPAGPCTVASDPGCDWVWAGDTSQAEPWVGPQPGGGGCDTCVYSGTESKIVMGLDEYARKCAYAMGTTVALADGTTQIFTVSKPVSSLAAAPDALSPLTAASPPPFEKGLFAMRLPVDPNLIRSVTVWFHTEDGEHPGGAYTRAEGIP
ncbi:MAG TPA: S8 family serine peptidase, partial [Polyangiaceae bacterium]|nr:S8 family serine peptidase [Polyangiaceae bacterium]